MRPLSLLAAISALALSSCFSPGDGQAPPLNRFYFPTGITLDALSVTDPATDKGTASRSDGPAPKYMYVASSDFDLQYRSSSLASFDLELLSQLVPRSCSTNANCHGDEICDVADTEANGGVPSFFCVAKTDDAKTNEKPCGAFGDHTSADKLLYPGRCAFIDPVAPQDPKHPTPLLVDQVGIGAFATDAITRVNPDPAVGSSLQRLFLPVRGDATLHWIDLEDGHFHCLQGDTDDNSCNSGHRAGNSADKNPNQIVQPSEPFAVDATRDGSYVAITNQTTGSVSLFVNDWGLDTGPSLQSITSGLPSAPVGIAAIPDTLPKSTKPSPGFLVAYRNAPQIDLLRVRSDANDDPTNVAAGYPRFVLTPAATAPINANSLGFDSRGIVIDDAQRLADYTECDRAASCDMSAPADVDACRESPAFVDCARSVHQPDVYVANRAPSSLLVGRMTPDFSYANGSSELPSFVDSVALTSGPSRVVLGQVKVPATKGDFMDDGGPFNLERRVFVVCFDSRRVFVYDPKRRIIEATITTGRGPFALAIDEKRGLGYIAHFTDSYLGVISLDQRFPQTYASVVASIGPPSPPRASK
jgi:hypothetical protein